MNLASSVQVGVLGLSAHSLSFAVLPDSFPLLHLHHPSALLQHPQMFFSSPSPVVRVLVLSPSAASWARGRDFPGFGFSLGMCSCCDALADGEPILWLLISIIYGNVLFFVSLPSFRNEKCPRAAGGEAGQLGATITYHQLPREWG